MGRSRSLTLGIAVAVASAVTFSATADAKELVYSIIGGPKHPYNVQIVGGWAKNVAKATKGRVTVKVLPSPAAPPPRLYDAVRKSVVDVAHTFNGFLQKTAPLIQVSMLPLMFTTAEANSVALWRTYQKFFKSKNQFPGVKLLGFASNPGGISCSLKGPMNSVADMQKLKMWSLPGYSAKALSAIGVTIVPGPAVRMYPLISKGTVDGFTGIAMFDAQGFKVAKFAKSCTVFPGAIFTPTFSMIMNRKSWDSLSPADQKGVMSVSGETFARGIAAMDTWEKNAYAKFRATGRTIIEAKGPFAAAVRKAWSPMQAAWVAQATKLGVDGKAALAFYQSTAKAVAAGK